MYVKIFAGILDSSIASDTHLRRFFMDLLLMADSEGNIMATRDAIAHRLRTTRQEVDWGLDKLMEPDAESRNPDDDGRRLRAIEGLGYGWQIINYGFYRGIKTAEELREANRKRQADFRERKGVSQSVTLRNKNNASEAEAEASSKAEARKESTPNGVDAETDVSACPVVEIVSMYHELLPMLPKVEKITKTRRGYIQQRWREDLKTLDEWRNFFSFVSQSAFLTGRVNGHGDRPPFRADIEWLCRPANFAKIAEEKYHRV